MALFGLFKKKEEPSLEKADFESLSNKSAQNPFSQDYPDANYSESMQQPQMPGMMPSEEPMPQGYNQTAFTMSDKTKQRLEELGIKRQEAYQPVPPITGDNKDNQLINSKLDTIKAMLESMNQRIVAIEREISKRW